MIAPNSIGWGGTTYSATHTSPGGSMSVFEGHVTTKVAGHYVYGIVGSGLYEGDFSASHTFTTNTTSLNGFRAWIVIKIKTT